MPNLDESHRIYRFGDYALNTATAILLKNGGDVRIRPQSFDVLRLLLENHGRLVSKDDLHSEVWGQKAVTDDSLAQCVLEVRRAIEDTDRKFIRTLPRRGYMFAQEVHVELVKLMPERADRRSWARWWWLAAISVLIAIAWFGVMQNRETLKAPLTELIDGPSIAVLPFINMTADPDTEYFSDGLSETLLHKLAQVSGLKVVARTSSFAFKETNTDIRTIGATLGVAHILEGSVRRAGGRVRITAQLVRADDGFHLWSETYDRELSDVFAVQDEIAAAVGIKLLASLFRPAEVNRKWAPGTDSFEAYDDYLRAQADVHHGSIAALRNAERYLRGATAQDPNFLDAKAALADLVMQQADTGMRPYAEGLEMQKALAEEVLQVDPDHSRAKSLLITTRVMLAANNTDFSVWKTAEKELRDVIAGAPGDIDAKISLGFLLGRIGNREEAVEILQEALEVDPLNTLLHEFLSQTYQRLYNFEAARDVLLRTVKIAPDAPNSWSELAKVAVLLGDGVLAIDSYLISQAKDVRDHELPGRTAAFLYGIGLPEEAAEFHQRVREMAPDSEDLQNLDLLRAVALDDIETAVRLARDIIDDGLPERWTAWLNASYILMFTSVSRSSTQQDLALLDEHIRGFTDLSKLDIPFTANITRTSSFDVLATTKTLAEIEAFSERISEYYLQANIHMADYPHIYLDWKLAFGDDGGAMHIALEDLFTKPVTFYRLWRLRFKRPFMREFMNEPRIQEAVQRWEREEEHIRVEVKAYLTERSLR